MLASIITPNSSSIDISYDIISYNVTFLGQLFMLNCYEMDYKFYINYLTMIEMFGNKYHQTFQDIDNFNMTRYDGYDHCNNTDDRNVFNEIENHMNIHMIPYQREVDINNILGIGDGSI